MYMNRWYLKSMISVGSAYQTLNPVSCSMFYSQTWTVKFGHSVNTRVQSSGVSTYRWMKYERNHIYAFLLDLARLRRFLAVILPSVWGMPVIVPPTTFFWRSNDRNAQRDCRTISGALYRLTMNVLLTWVKVGGPKHLRSCLIVRVQQDNEDSILMHAVVHYYLIHLA